MLTTSYFGNLRNVRSPLSISSKAPSWYTGTELKILAPKWWFFDEYKRGIIDERGYTEHFMREVLGPLNPVVVYQEIVRLAGDDATLLCYEKPGEFCHRRIVADWMGERLGISFPELPR